MCEDFEFYAIEDEFALYTENGMSRGDIAAYFGYDVAEFSKFIDADPYAVKVERKAKFKAKQARMKGLMLQAEKGNMKAIEALSDSSGDAQLKVEFKRGDMRTPDEIIVTNSEGFEKKSLSHLLSEGCSKS